ncbi:ABC transporter permease [Cohnella pontilimi]|uniref:ABC transporter permease n=1 Tax=Cohnella pontilimi TaxID=2564100 RepID=A0A4U0F6Q2_9BACL|nr:ABC transporter permease [Cohnella pontilimi]TJY39624.1 ABC transporter permease [Cohnella pontilimi]
MRDTLWLIRKTLISTFKTYKNWLFYLGLPLLAILLAIMTRGHSEDVRVNIGIVNEDGKQAITLDTIAFIGGMHSTNLVELPKEEADEQIIAGDLDAALIFPAGFSQTVKSGNPESVRIVSVKGTEASDYVKANLNRYIDNMTLISKAAGGSESKFDRLYAEYKASDFPLSAETLQDRSAGHAQAYQSIGYLAVLMLFAAGNLSGILLKERENRTYRRIMASPVSARSYVSSNIIVNLAVIVAQVALTLGVMTQIFGVKPGLPLGVAFFLLCLYALVAVSLSLAVAAFAKSSMEAGALQQMLFFPTSLLAGCMFPIAAMPQAMQSIAYFLPQYWLLEAFGKLQLGVALAEVIPSVLILVSFAIFFSLTAVYKFGRNQDARSFI